MKISKENLPTLERILDLLQTTKNIEISYQDLPENYISKLTYTLSDFSVYNRNWDKTIFISPCINNSKVLEKKTEIYECAKAFRKDADRLMNQMASTFKIDLQTLDGLHELKFKKSNKQRGELDSEWSYYLHGAECRFENKRTAQVVEVIIITKPEFGFLDCYFFYNYMATTERYRSLAEHFDYNHLNICKAIDLLVLEGVLTRVNDLFINRNVIAL